MVLMAQGEALERQLACYRAMPGEQSKVAQPANLAVASSFTFCIACACLNRLEALKR